MAQLVSRDRQHQGSWLPGDPRGFRTRHHDEHVGGDYRSPPPKGKYAERHRREQNKLKRSAVFLEPTQRRIVCRAMGRHLVERGVELVELMVSRSHFHMLARFTPVADAPRHSARKNTAYAADPLPRELVGLAKKHASHVARRMGRTEPGGLWAIRTKVEPIRSRRHQLNVVDYIRRHREEGAVVWSDLPRDELMVDRWC